MLGDVQPNPIWEPGRRCIEPDCITILCRLNPGPKCFVHTRPVRRENEPDRRRLDGALAQVQAA